MGGYRTGITLVPVDMQAMWEGGETQRFHTCMIIRPDTVGQHSYGVACVLMHVYPEAPAHMLRAALKHDMAESYTGDLPAPSKRALGIREQFTAFEDEYLANVGIMPERLEPWEAWLLKFCDSMDGLRVTVRERGMGNRLIEYAHSNFDAYVDELLNSDVPDDVPLAALEKCHALQEAMKKEWDYVSKR